MSAEHRFAPRGSSLLSIDGAYRSHGDRFVYDWTPAGPLGQPPPHPRRVGQRPLAHRARRGDAAVARRLGRPRRHRLDLARRAHVLARRRRRRAAPGDRLAARRSSPASASIATTASAPRGARPSRRAAGSCRTCAGAPRPAAASASRPTPSSTTATRTTRPRTTCRPSGRGRPTPASTPSPAAGRRAPPPSAAGTPTSSTGSAPCRPSAGTPPTSATSTPRASSSGLSRRLGAGLWGVRYTGQHAEAPTLALLSKYVLDFAPHALSLSGATTWRRLDPRLARHLHAARRRPRLLGRRPADRPSVRPGRGLRRRRQRLRPGVSGSEGRRHARPLGQVRPAAALIGTPAGTG